jgi:hypothetical protein
MSPAFDAATQTTVPTVSTAARASRSRQPSRKKTADVPASVISAIADVGFDDTPIHPTRREDTGTNRNPNSATPSAAKILPWSGRWPAKRSGIVASATTSRAMPSRSTGAGRSRSVRSPPPAALFLLNPEATAANERTIVGAVRHTVTSAAAATAPAPM